MSAPVATATPIAIGAGNGATTAPAVVPATTTTPAAPATASGAVTATAPAPAPTPTPTPAPIAVNARPAVAVVTRSATEIAHSLGVPKSAAIIELSGGEFGDGFIELTSADKGAAYHLLHAVPSPPPPAPVPASVSAPSTPAAAVNGVSAAESKATNAAAADGAPATAATAPNTAAADASTQAQAQASAPVVVPALPLSNGVTAGAGVVSSKSTPRASHVLLNCNPATHPHSVLGFVIELSSIDAESCTVLCRDTPALAAAIPSAPALLPFPPGRITLTLTRPVARWKNYILTLVSHENPEEDPEFVAAEKKSQPAPKPVPNNANPAAAAAAATAAAVAAAIGPPRATTFTATIRVQRDRVPLAVHSFDMNDPAGCQLSIRSAPYARCTVSGSVSFFIVMKNSDELYLTANDRWAEAGTFKAADSGDLASTRRSGGLSSRSSPSLNTMEDDDSYGSSRSGSGSGFGSSSDHLKCRPLPKSFVLPPAVACKLGEMPNELKMDVQWKQWGDLLFCRGDRRGSTLGFNPFTQFWICAPLYDRVLSALLTSCGAAMYRDTLDLITDYMGVGWFGIDEIVTLEFGQRVSLRPSLPACLINNSIHATPPPSAAPATVTATATAGGGGASASTAIVPVPSTPGGIHSIGNIANRSSVAGAATGGGGNGSTHYYNSSYSYSSFIKRVPKAAGQSSHTSFSATMHSPTHVTLQWNKTPEKEAQGVLSVAVSNTEQVVTVNGLDVTFRVVHGVRQRAGRLPNCVLRVTLKYPPLHWSNPVMIQAGTKVGFVIPPPPPAPFGMRPPRPGAGTIAGVVVPPAPGAAPAPAPTPSAAAAAALALSNAVVQPFQFFIKASRMGVPTHVAVEYQCASGTQERIVYVQQQPSTPAASTGPHPPSHPNPNASAHPHGIATSGPPGNLAGAVTEKAPVAPTAGAGAGAAAASALPDPTSYVRRSIEFEGVVGGFDLDVFDVYSTATPPPPGIRIAIQPKYLPL